jgi:hypothetical protein
MKPAFRSYDPFANLHPQSVRPAANDVGTRPIAKPAATESGRSVIEWRYPGMMQSICLMWGHPELNAYFDKLWLADGSQTPIDPEAMAELMLLAHLHQSIVPQRPSRSLSTIYGTDYTRGARRDVWEDTPRRR